MVSIRGYGVMNGAAVEFYKARRKENIVQLPHPVLTHPCSQKMVEAKIAATLWSRDGIEPSVFISPASPAATLCLDPLPYLHPE